MEVVSWLLVATCLLCHASHVSALDNGLGRLPPMGYNTRRDVMNTEMNNEGNVMEIMEAMVGSGLVKLGYRYFVVGEGWASATLAENGALQTNLAAFPSGIAKLGQRIHSKGMLFGLEAYRGKYSGNQRSRGVEGYEKVNAEMFASIELDLLREGSAYTKSISRDHLLSLEQFGKMRDYLNATGRPMFFHIAEGGPPKPWYAPMGYGLANSWAVGGSDYYWDDVLQSIDVSARIANFAGPGGWNDLGVLLGNSSYYGKDQINEMQQRTQFSMIAVLASPLILSMNVRHMSDYTLQTVTNTEVIAVNQDKAGRQGIRLAGGNLHKLRPYDHGDQLNVWGRPLYDGSWALVFVNAGKTMSNITCNSTCFEPTGFDKTTRFSIRDLWSHKDVGYSYGDTYTVPDVPGDGGSVMVKIQFSPPASELLHH